MRQFLDSASMSFADGAFDAIINSCKYGASELITSRHDVRIAPHLAADWLYPRTVWGGLWGFLFMLPLVRGYWWLRGIILSLGPSAFQMLYVFPRETGEGYFGLGLGALTPVFVFAANAILGLSATWMLRTTVHDLV